MPAPTPPRAEPVSDADVARYAAELCAEVRSLAQGRPRLKTLAYLLDMARIEAERAAKDEAAQ